MKYKLSNEIKQQEYLKACKLSEEGLTIKEIVEKTQFPSYRVLEFYMSQNGLKLPFRNMPRKHTSNNMFFESVDCFSKAYLLGFTYADGCIYNNHRFGYCLAKQDESIIDYIRINICPTAVKKEINNTKGAKNRQTQIQLRINNYRLVETLREKWGVQARKTLNPGLVFPKLSKELLWNFILGLNDGDGNIYTRVNPRHIRITICMTDLPFMKKLQEFIVSEGINIRLYERQGKTCKYYLLSTSNNLDAIKFCEKIYKNTEFYLERKYCKFKNKDNTELI